MQLRRRARAGVVILMTAALVSTGCSSVQQHEREREIPPGRMEAYLSNKPLELHRFYEKVLTQGPRNAVLNHMRAGLAAMDIGAWNTAERSFDKAIAGIEAVYAESEQAEKARSTWVKENYKAFKGEPYERAMAYYYRGLLYLREGAYDNARAAFKGGLLQDTLAAQETFSQDVALLAYLSGWASRCNGDPDLAAQAFAEAQDYNAALDPPPEGADLLLIGETGLAPRKVAVGKHDQAIAFERAEGARDREVEVDLADREVALTEAEDVFFQASTRGGRKIEKVLEGQAQFKDTTDAVGDAAVAGGLATMAYGTDDAAAAGLAVVAVGLIAKGVAAATRPEADLRAWDNLPEKVHLAALATAEESPAERATAYFTDGSDRVVETRAFTIHDAGRCALGWTRAHNATAVPDRAPGSSPQAPRPSGADDGAG
jgi:tetratricopeptide (TPR) repeat protein